MFYTLKCLSLLTAAVLAFTAQATKSRSALTLGHLDHKHQDGIVDSTTASGIHHDYLGGYTSSSNNNQSSPMVDMIAGFVLIFCSFLLLWQNERRYVKTAKRLEVSYSKTESMNPAEVNPKNEGKLVYAQGTTQTSEFIVDPVFQVSVSNSVALSRSCQMFQWVEQRHEERNRDTNTTRVWYTHSLEWRDQFVDSSNFHLDSSNTGQLGFQQGYNQQPIYGQPYNQQQGNPYQQQNQQGYTQPQDAYGQQINQQYQPQTQNIGNFQGSGGGGKQNNREQWIINSDKFFANIVKFGGFQLSSEQKEKCKNQLEIPIDNQIALNAQNSRGIKHIHSSVYIEGGYLYFGHFRGSQSSGDFRIKFHQIPCGPTAVVAQQQQNTFITWQMKKYMEISSAEDEQPGGGAVNFSGDGVGCCDSIKICCKEINRPIEDINWLYEKEISLDAVFQDQANTNSTRTKITRTVGWLLMMLGIYLIFSPFYAFLGWFPLVGGLLGQIGKWIAGLIALILGSILSILTITISWLRYRPIVGGAILVLCGGFLIYTYSCYQKVA